MAVNWSILAAGPSLREWDLSGTFSPKGPVIAINSAALADMPYDFVLVRDGAHCHPSIHEGLNSKARAATLIICRPDSAEGWSDLGYRTWPCIPDNEGFMASLRQVKPHSYVPKTNFNVLSVTSAIVLATTLGASSIDLYGVDMEGTNYSYGVDSQGRLPQKWSARWISERALYTKVVDVIQGLGVSIQRLVPE